MPITATEIALSEVRFAFDSAGDVSDVLLEVSYVLKDSTGNRVGRQTAVGSVWDQLTPAQKVGVKAVGARLQALAPSLVPT